MDLKRLQIWLVLVVTAVGMPQLCHATETYPWVPSEIAPGELAGVYGTAADQFGVAEANALLLELTNATRTDAGLGTLQYSGAAKLLASEHAVEMSTEKYLNHHSLAGYKCEKRFNLLGQTDFVTENIAYYEVQHEVYLTPQLVQRIHNHWLQSPGHLANLLHPAHTAMGSSVQVITDSRKTLVAAAVNFTADYGDYDRLPASAIRGETLTLGGFIEPGGAKFAFIGIGTEEVPTARTVEYQLAHMEPYSQPGFDIVILPSGAAPAFSFPDKPYVKYTAESNTLDGSFSAKIRLPRHWPKSAVYITVWATNPLLQDAPFCVMTQVVLTQ